MMDKNKLLKLTSDQLRTLILACCNRCLVAFELNPTLGKDSRFRDGIKVIATKDHNSLSTQINGLYQLQMTCMAAGAGACANAVQALTWALKSQQAATNEAVIYATQACLNFTAATGLSAATEKSNKDEDAWQNRVVDNMLNPPVTPNSSSNAPNTSSNKT